MSIRVVLYGKHKVIAEGVAAVLRMHADIQLVGTADGEIPMQSLCANTEPLVVVMGVDPRLGQDVTLTRWVAQRQPSARIVAFSTECDRGAVLQMMQAGAMSFVSTQSSMDELLHAIRAAAAGRPYLCPAANAVMVDNYRKNGALQAGRPQLGERESQVLCLIADGYSSKEIARNLSIAPSTVEVHRRNIMRKIGLHKVADLTRYAIRNHLVQV